jgi:hypothetical protein
MGRATGIRQASGEDGKNDNRTHMDLYAKPNRSKASTIAIGSHRNIFSEKNANKD